MLPNNRITKPNGSFCVYGFPYIENGPFLFSGLPYTGDPRKEVNHLSASTSPLPYTGNKSCIVNTILSVMPKHTVYIEPCISMAVVKMNSTAELPSLLRRYPRSFIFAAMLHLLPVTVQASLHPLKHVGEEGREEGVHSHDQQTDNNDGDDNGTDGVGGKVTLHICNKGLCANAQTLSLGANGVDHFLHVCVGYNRCCRHQTSGVAWKEAVLQPIPGRWCVASHLGQWRQGQMVWLPTDYSRL